VTAWVNHGDRLAGCITVAAMAAVVILEGMNDIIEDFALKNSDIR
jgi:hypothetical protein